MLVFRFCPQMDSTSTTAPLAGSTMTIATATAVIEYTVCGGTLHRGVRGRGPRRGPAAVAPGAARRRGGARRILQNSSANFGPQLFGSPNCLDLLDESFWLLDDIFGDYNETVADFLEDAAPAAPRTLVWRTVQEWRRGAE